MSCKLGKDLRVFLLNSKGYIGLMMYRLEATEVDMLIYIVVNSLLLLAVRLLLLLTTGMRISPTC